MVEQKGRASAVVSGLSSLGFGAAPIGNLYRETTEEQANSAVHAALDAGLNYFDTAPYYGFGLSEKRLGSALASHRKGKQAVVSSKVGRCLRPIDQVDGSLRHGFASTESQEPYFDYTYSGVMSSFESSLQRLGREKIDILFAHDLGVVTHGKNNALMLKDFLEGGYKAMSELKAQGLINAIGIGVNECDACIELINEVELDCILLAGRYTLLDQSAAKEVFPLCTQRKISVILGGPFNSGILAAGVSGTSGPHYYNYEPASTEIIDKVLSLEAICSEFNVELSAAALQFPCLSSDVDCVLAGFASVKELQSSASRINENIPDKFWAELVARKLVEPYKRFAGEHQKNV